MVKGTLLGTPNREPQEYSRYIIGIYKPGSLYSIIYLLYSCGSRFGVPSRVPLVVGQVQLSSGSAPIHEHSAPPNQALPNPVIQFQYTIVQYLEAHGT